MATFEKLENNRAKLTITVSPEAFGTAVQNAYQKTASRYSVPGFRKGKAPRKVIETMYGEGAFYEEAFELVWGDAYDAALEEHKLTAVDKPALDITTIGADGVVFTAEVQLKPEVTLGAYKKLEVPEPDFVVRDEDSACGKSGQPALGARVQWLDSKRVLLIESQLPGQRPQRPARSPGQARRSSSCAPA